jgi:DNA-binding MarR family transcriptional regulator
MPEDESRYHPPTGFLLLNAASQYLALMEKQFGEGILRWNELRIVAFLRMGTPAEIGDRAIEEAGISQQELASGCNLNKATVVHAVDRLEERKLAFRKPSPEDRRVNFVFLTTAGRKLAEKFLDDVYAYESEQIFKFLSRKERDAFRTLLEKGWALQGTDPFSEDEY